VAKPLQAALGLDVAVLHVQLAVENVGVGRVADGNEAALAADVLRAAAVDVLDADAGDAAVIAQHFVEGVKVFSSILPRRLCPSVCRS
jgi:hypothetical protein